MIALCALEFETFGAAAPVVDVTPTAALAWQPATIDKIAAAEKIVFFVSMRRGKARAVPAKLSRMSKWISSFVAIAVVIACSSSTSVGQPCTTAADCYKGVDSGALLGTPTCLTSITNGYCTHTCTADTDCCAVSGECKAGYKEVCAPFESQPTSYCFLSCDPADIAASGNGSLDPNSYCQKFGNSSFTCRSTGGGSSNVKFCG